MLQRSQSHCNWIMFLFFFVFLIYLCETGTMWPVGVKPVSAVHEGRAGGVGGRQNLPQQRHWTTWHPAAAGDDVDGQEQASKNKSHCWLVFRALAVGIMWYKRCSLALGFWIWFWYHLYTASVAWSQFEEAARLPSCGGLWAHQCDHCPAH